MELWESTCFAAFHPFGTSVNESQKHKFWTKEFYVTIKFLMKAIFLKISKTVCYILVKLLRLDRNRFQHSGKMWRHISESHFSTSYIRCFTRLIFPRIFHYLVEDDLLLERKLESTKPVEAKDRVNDYKTCESEEWLQRPICRLI